VVLGAPVSIFGAETPPEESSSVSTNPEKIPLSTLMQRTVKPAAYSLMEQGYGTCFFFKGVILGQRRAVIKQLLKVVEKGPDADFEQEYVCAIRLLGNSVRHLFCSQSGVNFRENAGLGCPTQKQ